MNPNLPTSPRPVSEHRTAVRRSGRALVIAATLIGFAGTAGRATAQNVGCGIIGPSIDIQVANAADTRNLGVAAAVLPSGAMKWFVSRSANAGVVGTAAAPNLDQRISVFDADPIGNIITTSRRDRFHHPNMVSVDWGHRDGEGYSYLDTTTTTFRSVVFWGDEARNLFWMDAVTETWMGQANLSTFGSTVVRAIGARPSNGAGADQAVLLYVSDFNNQIEEWLLDLATGNVSRTARPTIVNPGGTYGLTCFERTGQWYLAAHGQLPNSCPGVGIGLCHLTIIDLSTSAIVYTRDADDSVVGVAPEVAGGFAGGLQHVIFQGQPTLVCLQQGLDDWLSFIPYGGYGVIGPRDCAAEYLTIDGIASAPFFTGARIHNAQPNKLFVLGVGFPPALLSTLPMNPSCRLSLPLPVPATFLMPIPTGPNSSVVQFRVPNGYFGEFLFDAGGIDLVTGVITSTNHFEMRVRLSPF